MNDTWKTMGSAPQDGSVFIGYWPPNEQFSNPRYDLVKFKRRGLCLAGGGHREMKVLPTLWTEIPSMEKGGR